MVRAHGVNANQVFKWRRALKLGELNEAPAPTALFPVMVSSPCESVTAADKVEAKEQSTAVPLTTFAY